jgi:hypothetical protein
VEHQSVCGCYQLSFPEIKKDNGFFDVANTEWLVVVIQDEHFAIQLSLRYYGLNLGTEDEYTSLLMLLSTITITLEVFALTYCKI